MRKLRKCVTDVRFVTNESRHDSGGSRSSLTGTLTKRWGSQPIITARDVVVAR